MSKISINIMYMTSFEYDATDYKYSDFAKIPLSKIIDYESENMFPKDEHFTFEDLKGYHANGSDNVLCFCPDVNPKTIEWIETMIETLTE